MAVVGRMLIVVGLLVCAVQFVGCTAVLLMRSRVGAGELLPPLATLLGAEVRSPLAMVPIARARRLAVGRIVGQCNFGNGRPIHGGRGGQVGGCRCGNGQVWDGRLRQSGFIRLCVNNGWR